MSKKEYSVDRMIDDLTRLLLVAVSVALVAFTVWMIRSW